MCTSCTKHWYSFYTELKVKFCVITHQILNTRYFMQYKIDGGNLPVLKIQLEEGETVQCEAGAMSWMDNEIQMNTQAGGIGVSNRISRRVVG